MYIILCTMLNTTGKRSAILLFHCSYLYNPRISCKPHYSSKFLAVEDHVDAHLASLSYTVTMISKFFLRQENTSIKYTGLCIIYKQEMHIKQEMHKIEDHERNTTCLSQVSGVQLGVTKWKDLYTWVTVPINEFNVKIIK